MTSLQYKNYISDIRTTLHLHGMHLREVDQNWSYPSHEHTSYELNYVVSGHQISTVNGHIFHQYSGDLLLLPPGSVHFCSVGSPTLIYFCFHFTIDDITLLPTLKSNSQIFFLSESPVAIGLRSTIEDLISFQGTQDENNATERMKIQSMVFNFLANLNMYLMVNVGDTCDGRKSAELAEQIAREIGTERSSLFHDVSNGSHHAQLAKIISHLGVSYSQCNRVFKQHYGLSPRQYISRCVLQESKILLSQTNLSVESISSLVGYRDVGHFSMQFKRWTNQSPREFRANTFVAP